MNKCPRCENENLKEVYNYCPVCGFNLGTAPEVPVQEQSKVKTSISFGSGAFKSINLYNNKDDFEKAYKRYEGLNLIGLVLTPEVLKLSYINSIEEIFMIGILQDK